ncbi:MAG: cupredoxin domain-containing protein [Candidatus Eiseniibacteriota bacterium]
MKGILWGLAGLALLGGCAAGSGKGGADTSRVTITVTDKGFEPASVTVAAGRPVTLVVTRTTAKTCATELVMAAQGINQPLPLGQAVEITFTPEKAGELTYACAMDMFKGKVIVK